MSLSVLDKVRRWIDGDSAEAVLEEAARDAQVKPRSKAEEFIVKIARAIEEVMQAEMVPLPQGTTIIPSEYIIFLSESDDKDWQGVKRKGLEQGLYHILSERAREIAGKKKLETKSFVIELRVDGTLEKGELRVQHSWEDSASNKTGVLARPKMPVPGPASPEQVPSPTGKRPFAPQTSPNLRGRPSKPQEYVPPQRGGVSETIPYANVERVIPPTDPTLGEDGEEMTNVRRRVRELYRLEIWRNGVRQNVVPIFQNEIVIGRGSKSRPVDITLAGDPEISRRHLAIVTDGAGKYWIVNEGRNAAAINNFELPAGQRVSLAPGVSLAVCSYILRIQPATV
ncbi:MAG: DUF3662 domain-containing protein [Chloracidobacterium sp.]|nr:DUF3662 domain-containing protein [Chloracidobacterium sp.]